MRGQRLVQADSAIFMGWSSGPRREYYVRQLRDTKISPDLGLMTTDNLRRYGRLCGDALPEAKAQAA